MRSNLAWRGERSGNLRKLTATMRQPSLQLRRHAKGRKVLRTNQTKAPLKARPSLVSLTCETTLIRAEFDEACDPEAASGTQAKSLLRLCQHLDLKLFPLDHGAGQMSGLVSFDIGHTALGLCLFRCTRNCVVSNL